MAGATVKSAFEAVLGSSAADSLMRFFEGAGPGRGGRQLQVLTYHRVTAAAGFAAQMDYLAARYHVLAMSELLELAGAGLPLPPRAILITFDDGYRNFAEVAWSVLRTRNLPATLFVPTGFPDRPDRVPWWDRLAYALDHTARREPLETPAGRLPLATARDRAAALRRLKRLIWRLPADEVPAVTAAICQDLKVEPPAGEILGWDELRTLAAEGLTLGAHTQTHPNLARISPAAARAEIAGSLADLAREVGPALPIFAYPGGRYNAATVELLRDLGVRLAFTTRRGTNDISRRDQWLELRRINIGADAGLAVLRARLLQAAPFFNRFRPAGPEAVLAGELS